MKKVYAILALASCCPVASHAADPPAVPEGMLACSKLEDPGERVRCYDAQMAPLKPAPSAVSASPASGALASPPAPPAPSAAAVAPATAVTPAAAAMAPAAAVAPASALTPREPPATTPVIPEQQFGSDSMPASSRPRTPKQKPSPLFSSIKSLRTVGPAQRYVISLANGQVWRQEGASDVTVFFRVGQDVRIEKGALGSYHLFTSVTGARWIQVIREE